MNGCFAQVFKEPGAEVAEWHRGCCNFEGLCTEEHLEDYSGRLDVSWYLILLVCFPILSSPFPRCGTNDCNTMDPRTGSAKSLVPAALAIHLFAAITILVADVAVMT